MSALKEFADFITLNMANLAATYAQLLAESKAGYENFPADSRITSARKLLKAVVEAYESKTSDPLVGLFDTQTNENLRRWVENIVPPNSLAEIECLGQTLTPVVTNLEAGKFLWDMLLELRTTVYQSPENKSVSSETPAIHEEVVETVLPQKVKARPQQELIPDSETHFRKIFDHSNDAIFVIDPVQDKILDINNKACSMLDYSRKELLALSFSAIHPHVLPQLKAFTQSVVEQGHGWTNELSITTKSGDPLPAEISASIIEMDGNPSLVALVRDVSERRESEQRYKDLVNDLPVGIYRNTPGPEGHFLEANPAIVEMFEADTTEEFLKHNVSDLYQDPKDRGRFSEKMLRFGYLRNEELRLKTLKGRELWGAVTAVMKKDVQGQTYFDGIIVDITDRKRAEELSEESEERYHLVLGSSPDPIVIYDNNGQAVYINPAFTQTFGWAEDELLGKRVDFVPEENWPETKTALEQLFAEGMVMGFETRRLTKDGRILDVQQSAATIKDKDGNSTGSIIFIRDITERKYIEEALRESEEQYRTILENIEDGYYEVDIAGNLTFFNDALCKIWGYSEDELLGTNNRQYTDEENARKLYQTFNQVYRTRKPIRGFDWELTRKDGAKRIIETSVSLIKDAEGQPIGFRGIARDITEHRQAEAALTQRAHREQTIREITEKMRAATTLDELVKTTAEELGKRLSAGHAVVQLGIDDSMDSSLPQDNGRE